MVSKTTYKEYSLKIDEDYLVPTKESHYFYTSPKDLMDEFQKNFKNLTIREDGVISYQFYAGTKKKILTFIPKEIKGSLEEILIKEVNNLKGTIATIENNHNI